MSRAKPERIGAVLPGVLKRVSAQRVALSTIQRAWNGLVGPQVARHARPVSLRRGRLIVHAARPGESFALRYQREALLRRLREETREELTELIILPGDPRARG
jgi:predicted nucleic acid-binding Zn ribbon protein